MRSPATECERRVRLDLVAGGFRLTPMVFLGLAKIAMSAGEKVEEENGLTWGGGVAVSFSHSGQIGIVLGGDHVTGAKGGEFPYQDRLWLSVSLGVKLVDI
jgi:hypothetical protein